MEGVLLTLLRARGIEPTMDQYMATLAELGWRPGMISLRDAAAGGSS